MFSKDYRPQRFSEMIGQGHILKDFCNRSKKIDFPEVIILEGKTGSGKSTSAMIISKLLNCKQPKLNSNGYYEPCNECVSCLDIINEKFSRDVLFLDASAMSKDDVIEIEQKISYKPMFDKNRIAIIDEFQELSKGGKGATLKLLEKKRPNVHFLLCTMNIESVDKAVRSRAVCYKFKDLSVDEIANGLMQSISRYEEENKSPLQIPDEFISEGIFTLAKESQGSMRQALQYLEQVITSESFSTTEIQNLFGFVSENKLVSIVENLLEVKPSVLLDIQSFDTKELFYKIRKILNETAIYSYTEEIDQDWKKAKYNAYKKHPNFWALYDRFNMVEDMPYFNENSFWYQVMWYIRNYENLPFGKGGQGVWIESHKEFKESMEKASKGITIGSRKKS